MVDEEDKNPDQNPDQPVEGDIIEEVAAEETGAPEQAEPTVEEPTELAEVEGEAVTAQEPETEAVEVAEPEVEPTEVSEPQAEPAEVTEPEAETTEVGEPETEEIDVEIPRSLQRWMDEHDADLRELSDQFEEFTAKQEEDGDDPDDFGEEPPDYSWLSGGDGVDMIGDTGGVALIGAPEGAEAAPGYAGVGGTAENPYFMLPVSFADPSAAEDTWDITTPPQGYDGVKLVVQTREIWTGTVMRAFTRTLTWNSAGKFMGMTLETPHTVDTALPCP